MSVEIVVPQLGESVVEATILRWLKREGESVAANEPVVELETDKVNVEVPAQQGGVLERITKQEGETVAVGEAIALVSGDGAAETQPASAQAPVPESAAPQTGQLATREGARPHEDNGRADAHASPVARKLAEENDLDLRLVKGTGPSGKITKDDVASYMERSAQAQITPPPPTPNKVDAPPALPQAAPTAGKPPPTGTDPLAALLGAGTRREERLRISRRRQTIATRLVEAQHTAAMLTTFNEIDMTAVMEVRKRRRDAFKEQFGVGLGFMSFFSKAAVGALKAFPRLNAEIQGDEIVLKHYYDIGIAVSTEEGLVVPVVRDADKKTFAQIEKDVADLATRAREGKLTLPELQGGTFTITNGGVFGSLMSTPILNAPQVGILGLHKIEERPVAKEGQVVIRPMMYVALSYDHRIVDGSESVRFLVRVKELIEDPERLLLEG
jgi:2-oxoglutarate dehydrogenase E2 component (dihydrolipoamide succinyltransferase)